MRLNNKVAGRFLMGLGLSLAALGIQAQTPVSPAPSTPPAATTSASAGEPGAACLKCHDEDVGGMLATKHAVSGDPRSPWGRGQACIGCHGESTEHIRNTKVPPTVVFARTTPASVRNGACLACHQGANRMHFAGSIH